MLKLSMSHFTKIKTKLLDEEILLKSLKKMGFEYTTQKGVVKGFSENVCADIRIWTGKRYGIGFVKSKNGFEIIADWWQVNMDCKWKKEEFTKRLLQYYSYYKILKEVQKRGWQVIDENLEEDETIKLTIRA